MGACSRKEKLERLHEQLTLMELWAYQTAWDRMRDYLLERLDFDEVMKIVRFREEARAEGIRKLIRASLRQKEDLHEKATDPD